MPTVNIRQLRDTRKLKAWLRVGKTVELRERNEVIAHIIPEKQNESPIRYPDFAARRRRIFRNRTLPAVELLIKERGRY